MDSDLSQPVVGATRVAQFFPRSTIHCVGPTKFRNQVARDVGCLLDVDESVRSWSCQTKSFRNGSDVHVPDFMVETNAGTYALDVVGSKDVPNWVEDVVQAEGLGYQAWTGDDLPAVRLRNARDLLRYARYEASLDDRVRLLAALDENGSLAVVETLSVFRSVPPIAGLASLILARIITIDLDDALIGPESIVRRYRG